MTERGATSETDEGRLLNQGRYRLEAPLGKGATATVWRATDTVLGVTRAIKLLNHRAAGQTTLRRRLLSEARAMAQLQHPNILHVYDIGFDGDRDYVVMDLAEQGSLADWVDAWGPMPPDLALPCMVQVLSALHAAHVRGIVHRDVKPQNILLDQAGVAHLADFGIALLAEDQLRSTRTGMAMGSLAFMAPEQRLDARSVTASADVYAAGTTLYNLLTAANPVDLFAAGPDSGRWTGLPPELAQVVARAVSYAPTDRYPDARSMGQALAGLLSQAGSAPLSLPADAPPLPGHEPGHRHPTTVPSRELRPSMATVTAAITLLAEDLEPALPDGAPEIEPLEPAPQELAPLPPATSLPGEEPARDTPAKPAPVEPGDPTVPTAVRAGPVLLALAVAASLGALWLLRPPGPEAAAPVPSPAAQAPPTTDPLADPTVAAASAAKQAGPAQPVSPELAGRQDPLPSAPLPSATLPPATQVAPPVPAAAASPAAASSAAASSAAASSAAAPTAGAGADPAHESGAIAGTWRGNVHVQQGRLELQGTDRALTGSLTTTHPTTGVARTVEVRGSYDEARRTLLLDEQLDPEEDPTAGRYEATLDPDGRTLTGRYHAKVGGRTANIKLVRSGG